MQHSSQAPIATLAGATKRFRSTVALDDVDLQIEPGRLTALLGPNGAGKTTSLRLLLGLTRPTAGTVELFGRRPDGPSTRSRTGAMMQVAGLPGTLRVGELLDLFRSYYPRPASASEVADTAGLTEVLHRTYGTLSGGQKQRLHFALALCGNPDLLFLDEPTVGLDVETRRTFWSRIREFVDGGRSVILTTHYLEEADALADRIVVIQHGKIRADGSPHEIKSQVASRRIRCVTSLRPEVVQSIAGVQRVERDRDATEILTSAAESVARELLERDPGLAELEITGAGIEEAFLALTGSNHDGTDREEVA